MWRFVVTHFKFTKRLEDLADSYLRRALDVPDGHDIPPVRVSLLSSHHFCAYPLIAVV